MGSLEWAPVLLLLLSWGVALSMVSGADATCAPITVPLCMDDTEYTALYNSTKLPNRHGHLDQEDIAEALKEFQPILDTQCSETFRKFVCAEYLPPCELFGEEAEPREIYLPCRELCEEARDACEPILKQLREERKRNRERGQEGQRGQRRQRGQRGQRGQREGRSTKLRLRWPRAFKCRKNYNSIFASGYCVQG